jgi:hypothetical protein
VKRALVLFEELEKEKKIINHPKTPVFFHNESL